MPVQPWPLLQLLSFNTGALIPRQTYRPASFSTIAQVEGLRVVLIEDSWVSGATPLSAAGALHDAGASVLVLPIARVVDNPAYWGEHPYVTQMTEAYDVARWPI